MADSHTMNKVLVATDVSLGIGLEGALQAFGKGLKAIRAFHGHAHAVSEAPGNGIYGRNDARGHRC